MPQLARRNGSYPGRHRALIAVWKHSQNTNGRGGMRIDSSLADHGGGIDAAAARFGGVRGDWLDLSTGINRLPYPVGRMTVAAWRDLPDAGAVDALETAARRFWDIPDRVAVLAAPGASSLIARIPALVPAGQVAIPGPTYNEHARAFRACGWHVVDETPAARVIVHPNNPDGRLWRAEDCGADLMIIDESFGDVVPEQSLIAAATRPGRLVLKSLGKFWGLAGVRLGFAIGDPDLIAALRQMLGPWPVSGPAIALGQAALSDHAWAIRTRKRLAKDAQRLDRMMTGAGLGLVGGSDLFRLFHTTNAARWQDHLARHRIWTRTFPYSGNWLRLGLPGPRAEWERLGDALSAKDGT
jgi:cobalamin biosynthesis protein CobC